MRKIGVSLPRSQRCGSVFGENKTNNNEKNKRRKKMKTIGVSLPRHGNMAQSAGGIRQYKKERMMLQKNKCKNNSF